MDRSPESHSQDDEAHDSPDSSRQNDDFFNSVGVEAGLGPLVERLTLVAKKYSFHFHKSYPSIHCDDFYSLALEVLANCLPQIDFSGCIKEQETFFVNKLNWRFRDYARSTRQREKRYEKITHIPKIIHTELPTVDSELAGKELLDIYRSVIRFALEVCENFNAEKLNILELHFSGLSNREISERLGIKLSTAKVRLFRARKLLSEISKTHPDYQDIVDLVEGLDENDNEQTLQAASSKINLPKY